MRDRFPAALEEILRHEGGYVDHPRDPGGCTNLGITLATYRAHVSRGATCADVRGLTRATAARIYRRKYWDLVRGDDLAAGLDLAVFDFAVNSGPARAAKFLQRLLGVAADGIIGPVTLEAAERHDPRHLVRQLCQRRLSWLQRLRHWSTFGRGWSRRVRDVQAKGIAWADEERQKKSPF